MGNGEPLVWYANSDDPYWTLRHSGGPMVLVDPQPVQTVKELCHNCLGADDAICWELPPYVCAISVSIKDLSSIG